MFPTYNEETHAGFVSRKNAKPGNKFRVLRLLSKEANPCSKWPQVSGRSGETALSETVKHVPTMFKKSGQRRFSIVDGGLTAAYGGLILPPLLLLQQPFMQSSLAATNLRPLFLSLLFEAVLRQAYESHRLRSGTCYQNSKTCSFKRVAMMNKLFGAVKHPKAPPKTVPDANLHPN